MVDLSVGDLEDSPRIVLIVCNAAITHSSLSHDSWVQTHIGEGTSTTATRVLASTDEAADSGLSSVFLLDRTAFTIAHEQE